MRCHSCEPFPDACKKVARVKIVIPNTKKKYLILPAEMSVRQNIRKREKKDLSVLFCCYPCAEHAKIVVLNRETEYEIL